MHHASFAGSSQGVGLVLEIFSGTSRLTKACRKAGLRAYAVDKDKKRAENVTVLEFDITNTEQLKQLQDIIVAEGCLCFYAHFAPACGTCSRARERFIPGVPQNQQPAPLRSDEWPSGLPNLQPGDQQRVHLANMSYETTALLIDWLLQLGCCCSLENPHNSIFWLFPAIRNLLEKWRGHMTYFHHCMHGGDRDKKTAWWSFNPRQPTVNLFESLGILCNKQHKHASWRPYKQGSRLIFPTHQEAAYPLLLCQRIADILVVEAQSRNLMPTTELSEQISSDTAAGTRQLFTQQPRGGKLKPLVSEYSHYIAAFCKLQTPEALDQFLRTLPKGARSCHQTVLPRGMARDDMLKKFSKHGCWFQDSLKDGEECILFQIGIPRSPEEFIKDAVAKGHPRDILARVPDNLKDLVKSVVSGSQAERSGKRAAFLKKWLKRSIHLKEPEMKLKASLPDHLKHLLAPKRLLLFKEILVDLDYPDAKVVDDICTGFSMMGWAPRTGVFDRDVRPPEFGFEHLKGMLPGLNRAVLGSLETQAPSEHDDFAWQETMQEVEKGWLRKSTEVDIGSCAIAKRFPLPQSEKVRLIDDFSVCGVNSTFGLPEKLRVHCIDILTAFVATIMDDPSLAEDFVLVGRTFDLKSAYKQFGVDEFNSKFLKVAVKKPKSTYGVFDVLALPFGSTGSVSAFLRISAALHFIGLHMGILWTSFFDDFTAVCPTCDAESVSFSIHCLFRMLGIDYASEGKKAPDFSQFFNTLGLVVDTRELARGTVTIGHTEKRSNEILSSLKVLLADKSVTPKALERLHGRLVWYNSFIFGRKLNQAVQVISSFSRVSTNQVSVEGSLRDALLEISFFLDGARPAKVHRSLAHTWYVFTDGAFEPQSKCPASVGGVLINPHGQVVELFGEVLPSSCVDIFTRASEHPIYELEIFPLYLAAKIWASFLTGRQVVFFLDNSAAQSAYIRAVAATELGTSIIKAYTDLEMQLSFFPWFGRVPSSSNIADDPSRLVFTHPLFRNAKRVTLDLLMHMQDLGLASGASGNKTPTTKKG